MQCEELEHVLSAGEFSRGDWGWLSAPRQGIDGVYAKYDGPAMVRIHAHITPPNIVRQKHIRNTHQANCRRVKVEKFVTPDGEPHYVRRNMVCSCALKATGVTQ